MSSTGYSSQTVTVGNIADKLLQKPVGSGTIQAVPTVPAAILKTTAASGAPSYTKTSNTSGALNLAANATFGTGSLLGLFWKDSTGGGRYVIDCPITGVTGPAVSFTTPETIAPGQSDLTTVTQGATELIVALATLATADLPSNPDLTDYAIPASGLLQLLLTTSYAGAFELFVGSESVLVWPYEYTGDFYNWIEGEAAPWVGTVGTIRLYNVNTAPSTFGIGALMA